MSGLVEANGLNLQFWKRRTHPALRPETPKEEAIEFKTDLGIQPVSKVLLKTTEFCEFLCHGVKYGNREVTAIGTGVYNKQTQTVKINSIYPVMDASGCGASVTITARSHHHLHRTLEHWNEEDELAIFHSHPHFSSFKSHTDDQRAMRMACMLFGGVAVMIIIDPFSNVGVDTSAYTIDPQTKIVCKTPFQLVP